MPPWATAICLLSLIPNTIPLLVIFGSMGLLGLPLDAGTVMIGGLALGVAVDDTIHVATGFYDRTRANRDTARALGETLQAVLPAILSTSTMIAVAFAVLGLSEFSITRNLGVLTAGIMILCLLADVTLLPALLLRIPLARVTREGKGQRAGETGRPVRQSAASPDCPWPPSRTCERLGGQPASRCSSLLSLDWSDALRDRRKSKTTGGPGSIAQAPEQIAASTQSSSARSDYPNEFA